MQAPVSESLLAAPAKINLHLAILGRREDGYHELSTLFYPVRDLADTLRIEPGHDEHMYMRCPENPDLESTSNLIYKAWKAFGAATGFQPGLFVTLNKRIPMGGGLGGGSSDGAAMLRWLNDNAGERALPLQALMDLAAGLGADMPFFLLDGPALATGIGERLTPTAVDLAGLFLLLACPPVHVDTPWAFKAWDAANDRPQASQSLTSRYMESKNPSSISPLVVSNDFEPVVFAEHPILRKIKEKLIRSGAVCAAMSGSGASLFGLFRNRGSAMSTARALQNDGIDTVVMDCR
ncbi:4-(cytidine 5'-diphospho)-2-C-methyl-D-erythritol kinase [Pseudodesulfovibrio sp.]|uniref:4-(cytidine 5'-diphospho)-2-C-methyl-D-erythritol kinase n=1 Tax=Pseudodesulfovibrio sp. TaxID=2035812 RepID=UPI0026120EE5|nr:4-(cytidine 5'-diphospho)-2-C-methyl-D-erythritol kinase [Pseudodesulfovibrio sp.]MDD3312437.1 4-(cytidine 5'-diphospho)-2-C-methyl-D-erythritol kinase [Pseudodesulfovibrio sp.]